MESREPRQKKELRPKPPKWSSPIWYLPVMFLLLWAWQSTITQFAYHTIPYSEFKEHLRRHEVTKCVVKADDIQGEISSMANTGGEKTENVSTNGPARTQAASTKPFLFRSVRVEDPKLVDDLEAAGVRFQGERPSFISQFLVSWIVPLGILILLWSFISRRLGSAGESILSFG